MRGIGFLGLTTAVFWLVVAGNVTNSLLNRGGEWWEGDGNSYGSQERIELVQPVVTEPTVFWQEL